MNYPTAVEDYVKVIYAHTEWQQEPIVSTELAARLGLAPSSVTEMVKRLGTLGLVDHKPYGAVTLTADGVALALRMVRRHRLIESWLVDTRGYGWDEVHEEAEVLEHAFSDRMLESIDVELGRPTRDPHGDPIPTADGRIVIPAGVLLATVPCGTAGRVVRISDRDPGVLRDLAAAGVALDSLVTAADVLLVDGAERDLDPAAREAVWITPS